MVSRSSLKLLKKLKKTDEWMYFNQIKTQFDSALEYITLQALCKSGYLDAWTPPDATPVDSEYDIPEILYRISDRGKAVVEAAHTEHWREIRNWTSLFIALAAFIKSFFF